MLLSIKDLEVRKLPFASSWNSGEIDFSDSGTSQIGPLKADGVAELLPHTGGEIRVKGRVEATLETEFDRCLGRATFQIDAPFDLFYRPVDTSVEPDEEVAIDEGEAEMGFYELPGLVLEDILREQVLLQLPMQRTCKEDCRGICTVCGANRNETDCKCDSDTAGHPVDDRWGALKAVHLEDK
jgi:uncharacterized protein